MIKSWLSISTSVVLLSIVLAAVPAYADSGPTATGNSPSTPVASGVPSGPAPIISLPNSSLPADQPPLPGITPGIIPGLRSGANPDDPNQYPFLPAGMIPPTPGPRVQLPSPPAPLPPSSSTPSTNTGPMTDLALNQPYTVGTQWPDAFFGAAENKIFPNTGQLTDGKTASLNFSDPGWVGLLRQYGRSVVVNLGKIENVHSVQLDFLQNMGAGIDFPNMVRYYASTDGTHWFPIGSASDQLDWYNYTVQSQDFTVGTNVNAQYIRAQFTDKVWSFMDQFDVYGYTAATPGPTTTPAPTMAGGSGFAQVMGNNYLVDPFAASVGGPVYFPNPRAPAGVPANSPGGAGGGAGGLGNPQTSVSSQGYLTMQNPLSGGVNNMQLVYTGSYGTQGTWTPSNFMSMVAQENSAGQPVGRMFDAALFSPYGDLQTSSAGWMAWLNAIFTQGIDLNALNQTVGEVNQSLHTPTFKEQVVITLPGTATDPSSFGSLTPNGPRSPSDGMNIVTDLENRRFFDDLCRT